MSHDSGELGHLNGSSWSSFWWTCFQRWALLLPWADFFLGMVCPRCLLALWVRWVLPVHSFTQLPPPPRRKSCRLNTVTVSPKSWKAASAKEPFSKTSFGCLVSNTDFRRASSSCRFFCRASCASQGSGVARQQPRHFLWWHASFDLRLHPSVTQAGTRRHAVMPPLLAPGLSSFTATGSSSSPTTSSFPMCSCGSSGERCSCISASSSFT
mmetsp:Transcript_7862/g.11984  ORF Transcript_7862/g.11984 Transcript_7862/m.11984 type:complete len:211 (-) Transcript_7862:40-672(-)